jgi:hypothetical protein
MDDFIKNKNNVVLNKDRRLYNKVIYERNKEERLKKIEKELEQIKEEFKVICEFKKEERLRKIEKEFDEIKIFLKEKNQFS